MSYLERHSVPYEEFLEAYKYCYRVWNDGSRSEATCHDIALRQWPKWPKMLGFDYPESDIYPVGTPSVVCLEPVDFTGLRSFSDLRNPPRVVWNDDGTVEPFAGQIRPHWVWRLNHVNDQPVPPGWGFWDGSYGLVYDHEKDIFRMMNETQPLPAPKKVQKRPMTEAEKLDYRIRKMFEEERKALTA
jgi:hypothetical protein